MDTNIGYDRYGRGQFALRATCSITPAWSVYGGGVADVDGDEGRHGHGVPGADRGDERAGARLARGGEQQQLCEG